MRVAVVGAGMVGNRIAEELHRLDPSVEIDVLGDEPYEPYNRVLLTELLAGRADLAGLTLSTPAGARVHTGRPALEIDRAARVVRTVEGDVHYDHLVLATGARAMVIPVPGLRDGLPRGAHLLRSLDDARDVKAASLNARHAVVIGGGPLGLEVACGLRHRGVRVTVVDAAPTLLARDLDGTVADVLEAAAGDLGVDFVGNARIESVVVREGHVAGVHLADGTTVDADLVLLACGTVPNTTLAAEAGLETDVGVVVGHDLRTTLDPAVSAIGDCAQTPAGTSGLVAPGWTQARELARNLVTGSLVEPVEITGSAMRLKAVGLDVVTMGRRGSTSDSHDRVVALHDRQARRHLEVVVRDDTLVGLTCVGDPDVAAHLSTQFDRPGMIPTDPLHLLMGAAAGAVAEAPSPTTMPSSTTVCRCNGVSKGDLVDAWETGATSVEELARATLVTTGCGGCSSLVCGLADWLTEVDPPEEKPADVVVPGPYSSSTAVATRR
ncbi:FAD-dependent oxidoreductase [Aeromicrobium sp.]|uniref:FAD-dependent oxidoreductase n=1 Tax=Aeromicrobium sp. TaxID=1871063 RepID=UPI003D6C2D27